MELDYKEMLDGHLEDFDGDYEVKLYEFDSQFCISVEYGEDSEIPKVCAVM